MELRTLILNAAVTFAVILGLAWGIWLAGWVVFASGGDRPPDEGRGTPTTVRTRG
jgi:hypothetical protein